MRAEKHWLKSDWPFSKIEVYYDKIVIKYNFFMKSIEIPKSKIIKISAFENYTNFFGKFSLHITHSVPDSYKSINVRTFDKKGLVRALENEGYALE